MTNEHLVVLNFSADSSLRGMIHGMFVNNLFYTLKLKISRGTLMRLICPEKGRNEDHLWKMKRT